VDTVGDVGEYTSLVLDRSGYPVISYYDGIVRADLKVAFFNATASHEVYLPIILRSGG